MLKPSAKELVREKATHQVPVFFLERELYPFWLSPPHFLVLIDGFGYTPLEERSSDSGATRLGFAVLLKYFQRTGRFPQHKNEVPGVVITYLATQVDVDPAAYLQYDWQGRTIEYHRAQIRAALGFREASVANGEAMSQWLAEHVLPHEHQEDMVRTACYQHFRLLHLEPPKPDRVTRIIRSAYRSFETTLYETTIGRLDEKAKVSLDALLVEASPSEGDQTTDEEPVTLHTLRIDPGQVGVETLLKEVAKLRQIRALDLPKDLFSHLSPKVVRVYRQRASAEAPSHLRAHPDQIRYTLLAALCWQRSQEITDSLVDLLIQIVHRIGARAERKEEDGLGRLLPVREMYKRFGHGRPKRGNHSQREAS